MQEKVGKFYTNNSFLSQGSVQRKGILKNSQSSLPRKGILKNSQKGFSPYPMSKHPSSQGIEMQKTQKVNENFASS